MGKSIKTVLFNGLEFELNAPHDKAHVKHFLIFDDSQARLYKAKFERHPYSAEIHALVCAYMDDQEKGTQFLTELQAAAADDATQGAGEHFSQAMKITEQGLLVLYEDVTAITGFPSPNHNDGYLEDGLKYSGKISKFDISDLEFDAPAKYSSIYSKHDDLVEYLSSRRFDDLPEEMKEYGQIRLPKPGGLWPIGGSQFIDKSIFGASRGVRNAKKQ